MPPEQFAKKGISWNWTDGYQRNFDKIKEVLTSADALAHFDPKLPLGLACDASSIGIGAVLFHSYPGGSERPIAYASKSYTSAEQHYSQIEREALNIVQYLVLKSFISFYIYGRTFSLLTDHKPLLTIFGHKKGIPTMVTSRLQRWAIILSAYTYTISYKPTKEHGNADCLSRLPLGTDSEFEHFQAIEPVVSLMQEKQISYLPLSANTVKTETENNSILSQVLHKVKFGWPKTKKGLSKDLHPYFDRKFQLTVHNGCIMCGHRVVIPASLQPQVLMEIHDGHMGVVRMKALARMHVWWPCIDKHIEGHVYQCIPCQQNSREPVKAPIHTWETPRKPWSRLHIDFAGPFEGSMWLIVMDATSKWPEVIAIQLLNTL